MGTYTAGILLKWLEGAVVAYHPSTQPLELSGGIRFLTDAERPAASHCLYVGEPSALAQLLAAGQTPESGMLAVTSRGARCEADTLPPEAGLIETNLPLLELYNQVQSQVQRFLEWDGALRQELYCNSGLQALLEQGGRLLPGTILLLNNGYKRLAAVYSPHVRDACVDEIRKNGYQSFETIQMICRQKPLRRGKTGQGEFVEYVSEESGNYTIVHLIRYEKDLAARLCVILDGGERSAYCADLTAILAGYIAEYMFSEHSASYSSKTAFGSLAADLIELRLTDRVELEHRLKRLPLPVEWDFHVMLIAFEGAGNERSTPYNYIINQLERIFPFSNLTTYRGELLLVVRKTAPGNRMAFDEGALSRILEQYNGYAAVGHCAQCLTSLPPLYHQTRDALRLGRIMAPEKRIYFYEDYSVYEVIEMASEMTFQCLGSRNLAHLCTPCIITLLHYDKRTGGNLTQVLYQYLIHERNVAETARALFIHRNTMLYKVRKIEEVIGQKLDDPVLRERLIFSYHVIEYSRLCRKEDILVLKQNQAVSERSLSAAQEETGHSGV